MISSISILLWFISILRLSIATNVNKSEVEELLRNLNKESAESAVKLVRAQWEFERNHTEDAKKELYRITSEVREAANARFHNIVSNYPWKSFSCPEVQRQLKLFSEVGDLALPETEYNEFQEIFSQVKTIQQNTTICDYYNKTKCDLHLHPDIQEKLETSQNAGELQYLWTEWNKATQPEFRKLLESFVKLSNKAAVLNNYKDFKEYSLRNFDNKNVKEELETLWEDLKPLYSQIHAYVRRKLKDVYGDKVVPEKGAIPAHLLGNIWTKNWLGIAQKLIPFPDRDNFNFTLNMQKEGYTLDLMHKAAESYFTSMDFTVPSDLWFEEDKALESCHSKILNFYNKDVRIKDCEVSYAHYLDDIRSMTEVEYILQYSDQPFVYQSPADPGLDEALNNLMVMSASTFDNLKNLKLFKEELTEEIRLNRLFKLALEKISSIPFILVQELWRWEIFNGITVEESINVVNDLREKFQGISTFTKELSFDPGGTGSAFSKLSLAHHFQGSFLEFQLYESLCKTSDNYQDNNLNECNLKGNQKAGNILRKLMSMGSSKTLTETLSLSLGITKIDSKSLLKYFEPLMTWLEKENEKTGEYVGWDSNPPRNLENPKRRRKRSLEDYQSEMKDDDSNFKSSNEPDRFQRLIYKRSKNNMKEPETYERERKSTENEQSNEKKSKTNAISEQKQRRNVEDRRMYYAKNRRSLTKNSAESKEHKNSVAERQRTENVHKLNSVNYRNVKRHSDDEKTSQGDSYQKRNEFGVDKNYEPTSGSNADVGNDDGSKRFARKPRTQRRHTEGESNDGHQIWRRKDTSYVRPSRNAQWHTDTKKDISRLLHSFGFAVENDEKDKMKELKKKLKGKRFVDGGFKSSDSNVDMNSNLASKESTYENMMDYNRMKSAEGRTDTGEDKGTNKLWSVKSYLTDNAKFIQPNPSVDKKDSFSASHMSSSLIGNDEKSIGKKETSSNEQRLAGKDSVGDMSESHLVQGGDTGMRRLNIDMPSLQALLQKADMNNYGQKQIYTITPELSDNKAKYDMNPMYKTAKTFPNKYSNGYMYKYMPSTDTQQYKEKKEYREDMDLGSKSPYIIILGQIAPDVKERLMQEKGVNFLEIDKQPQLQGSFNTEEKKMSDKRSRASEQIYIVPIDLKNTQHNLLKPNHYAEHEHEAGHDPNTERDQESEEEQLHLEDNSKLEDKSNFYKTGKDSSSEFIISWNNDKNRKIVKRSKREHKKEISDDKMKVVRIAPMKESFLEGLLGKSLDHANLDDKNVKILIHDGLLNGNSELTSPLSGSSGSMGSPVGMSAPMIDQTQTASLQPSSSLSSLATSVLSALSPKTYSQVAKANNQRQDVELEEDNLKENGNAQGLVGKKKGAKLYSDDDTKKLIDADPAAKGDDACCKKIILTPCPPKPCPCPCPCPGPCPGPCSCPCPCPLPCPLPCPCPCPCPCPSPCPCPCPCPDECCRRIIECPIFCCKPECPDPCCRKPSECSLVNCQFKITKAKKPHERLTIMIYDRINPPAELPEPYDALAVISEILQRIQCCPCKPCCQLTEEDPDYPANDNSDQLKATSNQAQESKGKIQELSGEIPILGGESSEEDETDDTAQMQNSPNSAEEDKYQPKEKATPALDQLTVFNKDKLKPVFIELRKIDDIIKKRSQKE